jgi:TRAP-type C4-dicarboxylate transport system permease small subunit
MKILIDILKVLAVIAGICALGFALFFPILYAMGRNAEKKEKFNNIEHFGNTDSRLYVAIPIIIIVIVLILLIAYNVISGKRK